MPVSLSQSRVLVFGASSGIGRATAILFARAGARVLAAARRLDRLEQLQAELAAAGHKIEIFAADAAQPEEILALQRYATEKLGGVDTLVYATGTNTKDRWLPNLTNEVWDGIIETNLNGAYYTTRAFLPAMREAKKGHFIYVGSISGKVPDISGASYQAAKRGLLGMAHAIRVEEKVNGIRTCVICPGLVDTELMEKRPVKPDADTLGKALQPDDVADIIFAIASLPERAAVPELEIMPTVL
jgi:serine 3-dehydrogenase (NADP+)